MFLICENKICSRDSNAALSTEMPVTLLQCLQTGECDLILASDKSQWWNVSSVYTEVRRCKINPFQHCFQSRTKLLFPSVRMRLAENKETGMEELPKANLEGQQRPCKLAMLGVTNWTSHEFLLSCPGQVFLTQFMRATSQFVGIFWCKFEPKSQLSSKITFPITYMMLWSLSFYRTL